jgi:hypothetical protein
MAFCMRVLGAFCVAAALVLSTGGVAYRIKADPQPQLSRVAPSAPAAQASADEASAQAEQVNETGSCPAPGGASSKPVVIQIERMPSEKEFISLNSSGYNYSDPRRVPAAVAPQTAEPAASENSLPATSEDRD